MANGNEPSIAKLAPIAKAVIAAFKASTVSAATH